jgi:predicted ATPase with chaperone activity
VETAASILASALARRRAEDARTIADLAGADAIDAPHAAEALAYRRELAALQ